MPIAELVAAHGVKLKRHGADLIGLCPFHRDSSPSLVVSPGKNLWHCLGACRAGGSTIDWVMKTEGLSFRDACERLLSTRIANQAKSAVKVARAPIDVDAGDEALLL